MTDHDSSTTAPLTRDEVTADSPFTLPGFFAALSDGDLLAAVCEDCGKRLIPPRPACYACGGRHLHVEPQPKTGTVVSYTEVRTPPSALADRAPYTVAVVELDSGARLTGRVTVPYAETDIGMPVRLTTRPLDDDERELALDHENEWPIHEFEPA
ncbi:Zn-ribbon domain-containing OB-fold protein [Haloplanus rubicundus]|uniref:Zn-ribbon domain-containing OB-fold protein n=1 Tax=Haloplanus rubicundus TaxID=1547898 RepID=A0A345EHJ7_9EURY|nr:Zn-ribbon domain-containing OB-fold protein [Haloplanus rubicundus]AXG11669.1 Zn-ribbon domain-containing OB-fold protein [Haloplanus rubicundus]